MARRANQPTGRCLACAHVERVRIELLLAGGASANAVSRKFSVSRYVLNRHWQNHVTDERRAALTFGPVQREALASRVAEESSSVIDHFRAVRSGLYHLYSAAIDAGDRIGGAMLAGRLIEANNAIGKITGQLATSPLVQYNTQNNFLANAPQFAEFQAKLIATLRPYPEARNAVIAEFERIEPPHSVPQLAHERAA